MSGNQSSNDWARGLAVLIVGGLLAYGWYTNNSHEKAVAAAKDPAEIARLVLGAGKVVKATNEDGLLFVEYQMAAPSSYQFNEDAVAVLPRVFNQAADVDTIALRGRASLFDIRGTETNDVVARLTMRRDTNSTLTWKNVVPSNLPKLADDYWVHPAIRRNY